jgi:membrane protease YdiL (CAAX protease family)
MNGTEDAQPFWSYQDLALFLAMGIPSLLLGAIVMQVVAGAVPAYPDSKAAKLLPAQFLAYGFWFASLYLILRLRYGRPFWRSLGWFWPTGAGAVAKIALLGPIVALSVGLLGAILRTPEIEMPFKELLSDRFSIALVGFFAVTLGPLCEELAFRGFLLPLLLRGMRAPIAAVVAALPFALLHGPQYGWSWRHVLLITFAGTSFGWMRYKTGSTAAATLMHATYNFTFFAAFLFQTKGNPI